MKITGNHLWFLLENLKDSLRIEGGYDYVFKHNKDERRKFYDDFMRDAIISDSVSYSDIHQKCTLPSADSDTKSS